MYKLNEYLQDGACFASRAVLAYLTAGDGIEESWNDKYKEYDAKPKVARWENCREQGYVVSMKSIDFEKQLNIAFFEHRNSDQICAVKWEQTNVNSITIDTAKFKNVYKDKWNVSFGVRYDKAYEMAKWIHEQLTLFWKETTRKKENQNDR